MSTVTLLGSIFLPATALQPLATALESLGHEVHIADPAPAASASDVLAHYAQQYATQGSEAVIAHSNAGAYLPALLEGYPDTRVIFLDAILPPFSGGSQPAVPPALGNMLAERAEDGLLPPWTSWWPPEAVRELLDDESDYQALVDDCPRVSVGYLGDSIEVPEQWSRKLAAGYLALGASYVADLQRAAQAGWPTVQLELGHLGMLRDAPAVARELDQMLHRLGQ